MEQFSFGISLAFWLTIFSTLICVVYGAINWNKDSNDVKQKKVLNIGLKKKKKIVEVL